MSRDLYTGVPQRSPRMSRRQEMATLGHGLSSKSYTSISQPPSGRGSPVTPRVHSSPSQVRKSRQYGVSRSSNNSPLNLPQDSYSPHSFSGSGFHASQGYYSDNPGSPVMDVRTSSSAPNTGHRSGSTTRDASRNYHSLDRVQEREFVPIREPRERSLDRGDTSRHPRSRERSLERSGYRDREMERDTYYRETAIDGDVYRDSGHHVPRATHSSYAPNNERPNYSRDNFIMEIQARLNDLQSHYDNVKRELDVTTQKLGSSMHSIKTFWSPELKKERALRKEEAAKFTLINDQLKILRSENQKLNHLIKQLEEELRTSHMRNPEAEVQQHMEALYSEKDHMKKENFLLRETIKELEMRIETQKQTLQARDESIKKLMEMLQNKGVGKMLDEERIEMERLKTKLAEEQTKSRHLQNLLESKDREVGKDQEKYSPKFSEYQQKTSSMEATNYISQNNRISTMEAIIETKDARIIALEGEIEVLEQELANMKKVGLASDSMKSTGLQENVEVLRQSEKQLREKVEELRIELNRREQEILGMGAKMRTLEEQHQDYQRHIAVLKESLCAKEEHYNMLQSDVEELRMKLEEKNQIIEKKTQQTSSSTQEKNKLSHEIQELRDHMEIKDRKINVLQRKIENLEDLLREKDNQVDMARARLTAMQAHHSSSEGAVSSLEEAISDKEKQINQLRDQRDRAEQEINEERELHEREIAEYKMKMHGLESEMEKLQTELQALRTQKDISKEEDLQQYTDNISLQKQLQEKQKNVEDLQKKLNEQTEKLGHMEVERKKNEALTKEIDELRQKTSELEKIRMENKQELEKTKEEAKHSSVELERLLQIMSNIEEEKHSLNQQIQDLQNSLKEKDSKLNNLKRSQQAEKTKSAQMLEEARHRETEHSKEYAKAQDQSKERIEELEEALRESVRITADREVTLAKKESLYKQAESRISDLVAEVKALQYAHNARCTNCPNFKVTLKDKEAKLQKLTSERKQHLEEMFEMKHEALSAAISEKDAHLAWLEVSGIKNAQAAEQVDKLKAEKRQLMEKMKTENEHRMRLLKEIEQMFVSSNGKVQEEDITRKESE